MCVRIIVWICGSLMIIGFTVWISEVARSTFFGIKNDMIGLSADQHMVPESFTTGPYETSQAVLDRLNTLTEKMRLRPSCITLSSKHNEDEETGNNDIFITTLGSRECHVDNDDKTTNCVWQVQGPFSSKDYESAKRVLNETEYRHFFIYWTNHKMDLSTLVVICGTPVNSTEREKDDKLDPDL